MHRRTLLGTLAAGGGLLFAGCTASTVDGEVVSNETPLTFSHESTISSTYSGSRVVVDVTARNEGDEPITPEGRVPEVACAFLDGDGATLYEPGRELTEAVGVEETVSLEFAMGVDVDKVARYAIRCRWVEA